MVSGRSVADRQRRVDEVFFFLEDRPAINVLYLGRTDKFDADKSKPVWQIKRISRSVAEGNIQRTMFANDGKYNAVWDDRATYFPAAGNGAPLLGDYGSSQPSGLTTGGRVTVVTINAVTWTKLPATALTNRNAIAIQNTAGVEIKLNYDNTVATYTGVVIPVGGERMYDITDQIDVYVKASAGTPDIIVEELA